MSMKLIQSKLTPKEYILKISVQLIIGPPGSGKSKWYKENEMSGDEKSILFGHSHDFIDEQKEWLDDYIHLEGFDRLCLCIHEKNPSLPDLIIRAYHNAKFSNKIKCGICREINKEKYNDCPFHRRSKKKSNNILAPFSYIPTKTLKDGIFDNVIIDDCPDKCFPQPHIDVLQKKLDVFLDFTPKMTVKEFIEREDFDDLIECYQQNHRSRLRELRGCLDPDIITSHSERYVLHINFDKFHEFKTNVNEYGYQEQYSHHAYLKLFDYKKNNPDTEIIIVDANPSQIILDLLKERFYCDTGVKVNLKRKLMKFLSEPTPTIITRLGTRNACYPCGSIGKKQQLMMKLIVQHILDSRHNGGFDENGNPLKIGVLIRMSDNLSDYFFMETGLDIIQPYLHFGNVKSSNKYQNVNLYFIFGMYTIPWKSMEKKFTLMFHKQPKSTKSIKKGDYYNYTEDEELDAFRESYVEYEHYQQIMRARPFTNPCHIYSFGPIPMSYIPNHMVVEELDMSPYGCLKREIWFEGFIKNEGKDLSFEEICNVVGEEYPTMKSIRTRTDAIRKWVNNNPDLEFVHDSSDRYYKILGVIPVR